MTRRYELLYLIPTNVNEEDLPAITSKVSQFITEHGGTIVKDALWSRRKLAYPIDRSRSAFYWQVQYDASSDLNQPLSGLLNLQTDIIRFLVTEAVPDADSVEALEAKAAQRAEVVAREEATAASAKTALPSAPTTAPVAAMPPEEGVRLKPKATPKPADEPVKKVDLAELDRKLDEILDDTLDNT